MTCRQPVSLGEQGAKSSPQGKDICMYPSFARKDFFMSTYRTAESVSPKHPDKLCDQISDAILDAYLVGDPNARVAVEAVGGHGELFVVGEVTAKVKVSIPPIVKRLAGNINLRTKIVHQSPEIAAG